MGGIDYIMNHIVQTSHSKLSDRVQSPVNEKILSSEKNLPSVTSLCGSWKSRMLDKVRECGNVIKNVVAFDKSPIKSASFGGTTTEGGTANLFVASRTVTSVSSVPDVIRFSSIAKRTEEAEALIWSPSETEAANTSIERISDDNQKNGSFNCTVDSRINDSLLSFLRHERQVAEEFSKEDDPSSLIEKRKISAEPFLSYTEGAAEFVWSDNTDESFSSRPWNSLEHLDTSDIRFENPQTNSTFCETSDQSKQYPSSPVRSSALRDSGYDNHFSV